MPYTYRLTLSIFIQQATGQSGQQPSQQPRIQDLVKLLYESEDPLWELVRFEAEMSAAQDDQVRGWRWAQVPVLAKLIGPIDRPTIIRSHYSINIFPHPSASPFKIKIKIQAAGVVQQRVLAHEGITAAARDFLATKLQTINVPVRCVVVLFRVCIYLSMYKYVRGFRPPIKSSACPQSPITNPPHSPINPPHNRAPS
jgi:hypothetical protein